jgi:hypothetical protein
MVAGLGFVNQQLIPGADFRSEVVNPDLTISNGNILRGVSGCLPPSDGLVTRIIALHNNAFVETAVNRQLEQAADKVIPAGVGEFQVLVQDPTAPDIVQFQTTAGDCLQVLADAVGSRIRAGAACLPKGLNNQFKMVPTFANKFSLRTILAGALSLEVSGGGGAGTDVVTASQNFVSFGVGVAWQEFCFSQDNGVSCVTPTANAKGRLYVSHTALPLRLTSDTAQRVRLGDSGASPYTLVQLQTNGNGFTLKDNAEMPLVTQSWDGTTTEIKTDATAVVPSDPQRFTFQPVPGKSNVFYIVPNNGPQLEVANAGGVNSMIRKSTLPDPNALNQQFCLVGRSSAITFAPGAIPTLDFSAPLERYIGRLYPIGLVEEYLPLPGWFGCDPQIDDINGFDATDLRRGDYNGQLNTQTTKSITCVVTNVPARDMSVNTPLRTDNSMINPQWWLGKRVLVQSQAGAQGCRNVRLNGLNSIIACPLGALRGVFNTVVGNGNRAYPGTAHLRSRFNSNQWEVFPVRNSFLDFALGTADGEINARNKFRWNPTTGNVRAEETTPLGAKVKDDEQSGFRINA